MKVLLSPKFRNCLSGSKENSNSGGEERDSYLHLNHRYIPHLIFTNTGFMVPIHT